MAGDRVAIYLENCPQFAIAYFGVLRAGAIAVCVNPMVKTAELTHLFDDSGARVVVTSDHGFPMLAPLRERFGLDVVVTGYRDFVPAMPTLAVPPSFLEPARPCPGTESLTTILASTAPAAMRAGALGDTFALQYTSGTTGMPKGAELTHANAVANCELPRLLLGLRSDDRLAAVLPWFHITGLELHLNLMACVGVTLVTLGRFDLDTLLAAIERYRCTVAILIATVNIAIVNSPKTRERDLSSLRLTLSGGAPVPAEIARRWEALIGRPLLEGYGLTETCSPTHTNPPGRQKYGSVGVPLPLIDVKIVSLADGVTEMPAGESGEIVVRGPMVMKGYWRRPEATAEVLRDGWLYTGDVGRVDEDGYFVIEERKKDLIKASGYSVFPAEVEALMYRHPAVAEAGVIGVADPYRGEEVQAFVVLKPGATATADEIVQWCRREMAVYKAPRRVHLVDTLPKTGSGKILKRLLREQAEAAAR